MNNIQAIKRVTFTLYFCLGISLASFGQVTWDNLFAKANKQYNKGKLSSALSKAKSTTKTIKKKYGDKASILAMIDIYEILILENNGEFLAMEAKIKDVLSKLEVIQESDFENYALNLCKIADAYLGVGYLEKVEQMMTDLLAKVRGRGSVNEFVQAEVAWRLAFAQTYREELDKVETYLPQLIQTWDILRTETNGKEGKLSSADIAYRGRQYAQLLTLSSEIFTLKGEYNKADSLFKRNENTVSKLTSGHSSNAFASLARGSMYFDSEKYEEAQKIFEKALKSTKPAFKNYLLLLERIALAHIYNANPNAAGKTINDLDKFASAFPGQENIYHLTGDWLFAQNKVTEDISKTTLLQIRTDLENILAKPQEQIPHFHSLRLKTLLTLYDLYVHSADRDLAKAEEYLREAIQLSKNIYGEASMQYLFLQIRWAKHFLTYSEDYEKVRNILKEENFKKILTQRNDLHKDFILTAETIAEYYDINDAYKEALDLMQRLTQIMKIKYGDKDVDFGKQLVKLAESQIKVGEYKKAEENVKAGSKIIRKQISKRSTEYADALSSMAKIYGIIGYYSEAEDLLRTASKIYRKNEVEDLTAQAKSVEELAFLYIRIGEFAQTEELLNQILIQKEKKYGKESLQLINPLNQLGQLYLIKGDYASAEKLLSKAITISQKIFGDKSLKTATSLELMSKFYFNIGDFDQANELTKRVIEIQQQFLGNNHVDLGNTYIDMAAIRFNQDPKNSEEALDYLKKAKKIMASNFDVRHPLYAEVLKNEGEILIQTQKYNEALQALEEANTIWLEKLETRNINSAQVYSLMGDVYVKQKNFKLAQANYEKAGVIYKKILSEEHPDYVKTLSKLGQMYFISGDYKEANRLLESTTASYLNFIKIHFPSLSDNEKKKYWNKIQTDFEFYNSLAVKQAESNPSLLEKMYNFRLSTKAILLSSAIKVRQSILKGSDNVLKEKYKEWLRKKEELTGILSMTTEQLAENEINPDKIKSEINQLEKELSEGSDLFAESLTEDPVTWEDVRKTLNKNEAAIEMIRYREFQDGFTDNIRYAALIITPETRRNPELVLLENGNLLEDRYFRYFKNMVISRQNDKNSYKNYWKPIEDKIPNSKVVYFSPDGVYNQLNVEAFWISEDNYVIDKVNVRLVSNTKDLVAHRATKEGKKSRKNKKKQLASENRKIALFGNPTFYKSVSEANKLKELNETEEGKSAKPYVSPLPGTKEEVKGIQQLFTDKNFAVTLYSENSAQEKTLKDLSGYYVVHIATHGFFEEDLETEEIEIETARSLLNDPLRKTGLLANGAGDLLAKTTFNFDLEDGILTAYEAMGLDLDGVELLVMSACETGLGEVAIGEGVYGLQRAFLVAGVNSLIMSLFRVDDEVTQKMMVKFYQKWIATGNKRQAFSEAQKEIKAEYKHPAYWGAFNMMGID